MRFVCSKCRGALAAKTDLFHCSRCRRDFPVFGGIADFRLWPDPYIGIEHDRGKGERLFEAARQCSFSELLQHYYDITEEDPNDLAAHWIVHSLAEVEIAEFLLRESGLRSQIAGGALLDIGCSTGALLIAAHGSAARLVSVDVAFRWLAVAHARLRDAAVSARHVRCRLGRDRMDSQPRVPFLQFGQGIVSFDRAVDHAVECANHATEGIMEGWHAVERKLHRKKLQAVVEQHAVERANRAVRERPVCRDVNLLDAIIPDEQAADFRELLAQEWLATGKVQILYAAKIL